MIQDRELRASRRLFSASLVAASHAPAGTSRSGEPVEAAIGMTSANKDVVDSNRIRGGQRVPLVHFLFSASLVAAGHAPAGDKPQR